MDIATGADSEASQFEASSGDNTAKITIVHNRKSGKFFVTVEGKCCKVIDNLRIANKCCGNTEDYSFVTTGQSKEVKKGFFPFNYTSFDLVKDSLSIKWINSPLKNPS
jgi:hypothetical protein